MAFYAKIKHRRDTEDIWSAESNKNQILEDGEIIVVNPTVIDEAHPPTTPPRLKIGNGKSYEETPFLDSVIDERLSTLESYIGQEGGIKTFDSTIITSGVFSKAIDVSDNTSSVVNIDIDLSQASCFLLTAENDSTIYIKFIIPQIVENLDSIASCFTLIIKNGGGASAVVFQNNVAWADNYPPKLTNSGVDVLTFISMDGGNTWYGSPSIINAIYKPTLDTTPT